LAVAAMVVAYRMLVPPDSRAFLDGE